MKETIVLEVVQDFPGGRIRAGDHFVLDWTDPIHPISEVRHHGPDFLTVIKAHLSLLRCLRPACHRCDWSSICPLASSTSRPRHHLSVL